METHTVSPRSVNINGTLTPADTSKNTSRGTYPALRHGALLNAK